MEDLWEAETYRAGIAAAALSAGLAVLESMVGGERKKEEKRNYGTEERERERVCPDPQATCNELLIARVWYRNQLRLVRAGGSGGGGNDPE